MAQQHPHDSELNESTPKGTPVTIPENLSDPLPKPTTAAAREAMEANLEDMLAEAEETATRLRRQLAELRSQPVPDSDEDDEAKHEAINSLFSNLEETQVHWGKVRTFFEEAVRELFGHHGGQRTDTGGETAPTQTAQDGEK